jgi:hypothetical protein
MFPVTRIGEIRRSASPRSSDIHRNSLRLGQFGSDLPDEKIFRELDPSEPIQIVLQKRNFRGRAQQNAPALNYLYGFLSVTSGGFLARSGQ